MKKIALLSFLIFPSAYPCFGFWPFAAKHPQWDHDIPLIDTYSDELNVVEKGKTRFNNESTFVPPQLFTSFEEKIKADIPTVIDQWQNNVITTRQRDLRLMVMYVQCKQRQFKPGKLMKLFPFIRTNQFGNHTVLPRKVDSYRLKLKQD